MKPLENIKALLFLGLEALPAHLSAKFELMPEAAEIESDLTNETPGENHPGKDDFRKERLAFLNKIWK